MEIVRDPVCGELIHWQKANAVICFDGRLYYFCCKSCLSKFNRNPKKFRPSNITQ